MPIHLVTILFQITLGPTDVQSEVQEPTKARLQLFFFLISNPNSAVFQLFSWQGLHALDPWPPLFPEAWKGPVYFISIIPPSQRRWVGELSSEKSQSERGTQASSFPQKSGFTLKMLIWAWKKSLNGKTKLNKTHVREKRSADCCKRSWERLLVKIGMLNGLGGVRAGARGLGPWTPQISVESSHKVSPQSGPIYR